MISRSIKLIYIALTSLPSLGLVGTLKLLLAMRSRRQFTIVPKGFSQGVLLRGGTTDWKLFYSILCRSSYSFRQSTNSNPNFIIDAGANAGYATLALAHTFPNALIVALEPELSNYELLVKNTEKLPNVTPLMKALHNADGEILYLDNPNAEKWSYKFAERGTHDSVSVETASIWSLLRDFDKGKVDVLKIDIEGAEKSVFSGDSSWLGKVNEIYIEIHEGAWKTVFKALLPYDFDCRISREYLVIKLRSR